MANLVTVPVIDGKIQIDVTSPGTVSLVADISGLVLSVTAVNTAAVGDLDVYPDVPGQAPPVISNLNFGAGATVPNLVIVPISNDGKIDFYVHSRGSADLLADVQGYFSPEATSKFVPSHPSRIFDTRLGQAGGELSGVDEIDVDSGRMLQVPTTALTADFCNVTVTEPIGPGHVTVYPHGSPIPTTSNLNYVQGQTVPNSVLAPMNDGIQAYYNYGSTTQMIVDFFGYFANPVAYVPPAAAATTTATTASAAPAGKAAVITRAQF